jgi:tetratricopeptide (TPR) repeat protein
MMKKSFLLVVAVFVAFAAFSQDAAEMITKANEALKANDFVQAFELYDKAMTNLGDVEVDKAINFNIGYAAMQANKNEEALSYFDKAIEAGANVSKCYEYKGSVYNKMKDYPNALASYEKALEVSEGNGGALLLNAAVTAYRLENFEKAVKYFDQAYQAGFKAEDALLNKAMALKKMDNDEAYKETLVTGAEKFPGNKKITGALANVYVQEGNALYKDGVEILNAANTKVNDGSLTTDDDAYKAEVEKAKAEFGKAAVVLENALKLDPENQNAQKLLEAINAVK